MRKPFAIAIVILLFLNIFLLIPAKGSEPADWSKPRPTADRTFGDSLGKAVSDEEAALALGVDVRGYEESEGVRDHVYFSLDLSASTREGIHYSWSPDVVYSWVSTTEQIEISGDDSYVLINLGFPVLFYGINYSSMYLFSNGFVSFTSPDHASTSPVPLPSDDLNDTIVAPFWRKLRLSQDGSIKRGYVSNWAGELPHESNYEVFTWDDIPDINGNRQTFQLLIQHRPVTVDDFAHQNKIFFQYLSVTNDVTTTIGVQDRTGHDGDTQAISEITDESAGGFNAHYGYGYRIWCLEFLITKGSSDSQAAIDLSTAEEGGFHVDTNPEGSGEHFASYFGKAIQSGSRALLTTLPHFGSVIFGFFILWDISSMVAAEHLLPASGTLTGCGYGGTEASGVVYSYSDTYHPWGDDGWYHGAFDASFSDLVTWWFADNWDTGVVPHTVTVTANAYYANVEPGSPEAHCLTCSMTLNMYTGSDHYIDVGSCIQTNTDPIDVTGVDVWIDGQVYSTPLYGLIVSEGDHTITVPASFSRYGTNYIFNEWSTGQTDRSIVRSITSDFSSTARYVGVGDITGDGVVDIFDAIQLGNAFGTKSGDKRWNPRADLNKDGNVDIFDAILLANNFDRRVRGSEFGESFQPLKGGQMLLGGTNVFVDPSQVTVFKDEFFNVNVGVTDVTDLLGWQFTLYWNRTVLNCTNYVVQIPTEWQDNNQTYGDGLETDYNATHSRFLIAEAGNYPAASFNGSMTLATLTFRALQPGTTSLALSDVKLGNSIGDPVDHTETSGSVDVYHARYMRSDAATINGLNANLLNATETTSYTYAQRIGQGLGASFGIRAWVRASNGTEYEVTLDGQTGTPKATVSSTGWGTVNVTQMSMETTFSLVIRVYVSIEGGAWTNMATFTTTQLGKTSLQETTWSVYYYVSQSYSPRLDRTTARFYWGDASHMSQMQNLQFN